MPIFNGGRIGSNNVPFTGTKSDDPNYSNVSLLLNGNGTSGSTTFTDSSSYGHTVTPVGDAKISTVQSKFGGASMYFDGSGDSLSLPLDNSLAFGSGEFTFEFWLFRNASSFTILDTRALGQNPSGQIIFSVGSNGEILVTESAVARLSGGSTTINSWNHYALVRDSSNVITGYINGVSVDTWSTSLNFTLGSAPRIGSSVNNTGYLNGYIDDLRITKGVARYTSNFNPPTAELPDPSDPDFDSVSLLLHGDGANGSTTFIDSSSNSHTVTPSGNAQISTTQSKFGGASMYFDGTGDYLSISNHASFDFGSGNFTVEFWIYFNSVAGAGLRNIFNKRLSTSVTNWIWFGIYSGSLVTYISSNGSSWDIANLFYFGNTALSTGQWYHIALVRSGQEIAAYVNGTKSANTITTSSSISPGSYNFNIGADTDNYYSHAYIDDLRVTKGVARYTSNFNPPTAPFPND